MSASISPEVTGLKIGSALRISRLPASQERHSTSMSQETTGNVELRKEIDRITDSGAFIIRAVESLSKNDILTMDIDIEVILKDVEVEESSVFSSIPHYLEREWKEMTSENARTRREAVMKVDAVAISQREGKERVDYSENGRIVIDPSVPLPMPFSRERYPASTQRKSVPGYYHSLFFGEGEPVVFTPPEQNKRKEIEKLKEEQEALKKKMQRTPRSEVIQPKKILKVPNDFVPSCAQVDNSLAQQELRKKNEMEKNKMKKSTTPKKKEIEPAH
ncbi:putative mucin-associated surface protein (MASP) [Trypanosoma rangeli]|uniref:Putative mucin-associated surface protein (MASP) n=1 Tax=Trypanosoma rangeli TaxID=5698 RepID=A0A422NX50_TRYRA|nr:putative mucin-associated surface protein (MASP) [Trypanosoma rangeli]RNF10057.1 putative mucin-associated surface protein (MASP) [Trypanosoma rangeli]|eukprot:RNF10057.1 putative mucin-associated surface protein (MASP) [Trypanosoma rangeli]